MGLGLGSESNYGTILYHSPRSNNRHQDLKAYSAISQTCVRQAVKG